MGVSSAGGVLRSLLLIPGLVAVSLTVYPAPQQAPESTPGPASAATLSPAAERALTVPVSIPALEQLKPR